MFGNNDYALQRVHALWTLEGMGVIDEELLIEKLKQTIKNIQTKLF